MDLTIKVAHDFNCPWCWIGFLQAKRLSEQFGVAFDWVGYELYPDVLEWPEAAPAGDPPPNKPTVPSRFQLALAAEGVELPDVERPNRMRTHFAHEALEHAKTIGVQDAMVERLYVAYWKHGLNINEVDTIRMLATGLVPDLSAMVEAVLERRYKDRIVSFDEPAYKLGVYNVPTFWIGGERYAEQPRVVLEKALQELIAGEQA